MKDDLREQEEKRGNPLKLIGYLSC